MEKQVLHKLISEDTLHQELLSAVISIRCIVIRFKREPRYVSFSLIEEKIDANNMAHKVYTIFIGLLMLVQSVHAQDTTRTDSVNLQAFQHGR